jgi:hypothetical protein
MQTKIFNAYRITHKNGSIEDINALDLVQALQNMEIPETESPVLQTFLIKEGIRTLVEDEKTEVLFNAVVAESGGGSIATPATGRIHVGDMVQFRAIPDRTYEFVCWKLNGHKISEEAVLNFVMPELGASIDTAVFEAEFRLSDIAWTTAVSPAEASTAGCIAFPTHGTSEAFAEEEFLAVPKTGFVFDHWDVNGVSVSDNALLQAEVRPLAEGEAERVYTAVFRAE